MGGKRRHLVTVESRKSMYSEPLVAGLGERIKMVMTCFVTAVASKRLLAVDWLSKQSPDPSQDQQVDLQQLFEEPGFDWSGDWLSALHRRPEEVTSSVAWCLQHQKALLAEMLCDDIGQAWSSRPVVALGGHAWLDLPLINPHFSAFFEASLGTESNGIIRVFEMLASKLFVPVKEVRGVLSAIQSLGSPNAKKVGVLGVYRGVAESEHSWHEKFCKILGVDVSGLTPQQHRAEPKTFVIASTDVECKSYIRYLLQGAECADLPSGRERCETQRIDLATPAGLDALEMRDSAGAIGLGHYGVMVHVLATGSRILHVARARGTCKETQGQNDDEECRILDARQDLIDMWLLGMCNILVRTAASDLWIMSPTLSPGASIYYVDPVTLSVHKQVGGEPSAGGQDRKELLAGLESRAYCFDLKQMGIPWLPSTA